MKTIQNIAKLSTLIAAIAVPSAVFAQETLYVGGPGGDLQKAYETKVIPAFEARTGAKVVYVPASSNDTVAKLIAQKGRQEFSIVLIDSGPMARAVEQKLCAPLPDLAVLNDIYPTARMPGGTAVGYGFYATGLGYNKDVFAKNGWEAPTSWNDLGDPKFKGMVVVGPFSGYGVEALAMVARANGGDEQNIEPGFKFMAEKIAPNVLTWEGSQANLAQMFQSGEAALVAWSNIRVQLAIDQGAPVAFVYPKEGARQGLITACVVEGAPQPNLAQEFLKDVLSPAAQIELATSAALGPTNSKVELDPTVASKVVYGADQADALVAIDWLTVNKHRDEWTQRWNREVER